MILGAQQFTLRRFGPTRYSGHQPLPQSPSTSVIFGTFQPLNGEELQLLPEGDRVRDTQKFYTEQEIRTVNELTETPADELEAYGQVYEVHRVERHGPGAPLPHFKALLVRKQL